MRVSDCPREQFHEIVEMLVGSSDIRKIFDQSEVVAMDRYTGLIHFTGLQFTRARLWALALLLCAGTGFAAESSGLEKEFLNVGSTFSNVVTTSHGGVTTIYGLRAGGNR